MVGHSIESRFQINVRWKTCQKVRLGYEEEVDLGEIKDFHQIRMKWMVASINQLWTQMSKIWTQWWNEMHETQSISAESKPTLYQCNLYKYRFQTKQWFWTHNAHGWGILKWQWTWLRKSELTMDMVEENWNGNGHGWKNLKLQKIWNCNGHGWGRPRVLLLFRLFSRREKCSLALPSSGWEKWNLFICLCLCLTTNG